MKNTTEIVLVVDRSGSMSSIKNDIEGGFKTFLDEQKKLPGEAYVTYYQFDSIFEKLFEKKSIASVDGIKIDPRGGTALVDATAKAINEVGARLAATAEADRPETVVFVILTDGEENSSREFSVSKMKEMVEHQKTKYNWKFIFLGANFDALAAGAGYGFSKGTTLNFTTDSNSIKNALSGANSAMCHYRSVGATAADYTFSDQERFAAFNVKDPSANNKTTITTTVVTP